MGVISSVPPCQVVLQYLLDLGVVEPQSETDDWSSSYSAMPESPDNAVSLHDDTPVQDGRIQRTGEHVQHYGIHVRIRSLDYNPGWVKGQEIIAALETAHNAVVTIGAITYTIQAFSLTMGLTPFGREEQNLRNLFSINGILTAKEG